jgi:hypothetical protein
MGTKDKYDVAVEYLTEHPEEIEYAWHYLGKHPGAPLFVFVTPNGRLLQDDGTLLLKCGCLTTIRAFQHEEAYTPELTAAIRADERIPSDGKNATVADLPVFAEWQRRIDKELNRAI